MVSYRSTGVIQISEIAGKVEFIESYRCITCLPLCYRCDAVAVRGGGTMMGFSCVTHLTQCAQQWQSGTVCISAG